MNARGADPQAAQIEDHGREIHVWGPPGCGKTTWLSKRITSTVHYRGADAVLVASFTTAAAAELGGRDLPLGKGAIGTLHSHAYRAIDRPTVAAERVAEWNDAHPGYALSAGKRAAGGTGVDLDVAAEEWTGVTDGDVLSARYDSLRNQMAPRDGWPKDVTRFAAAWEAWKAEADVIDFTDMIETALRDTSAAPGSPEVGFFDESQDNTRLELSLIRHWGRRMDKAVLAGDDDQAQAPWTRVLTAGHGWVPMRDLDVERHRLVSFDLRGSQLNGLRRGHPFQVAAHQDGRVGLRVEAGGRGTDCTPDHRWWARIDPGAAGKCVVYLMRRGSWWRVGWTQLLRGDGAFHLGARARLEGADAAWVLGVCDSRSEASKVESIVAARYGLPTACFNPVVGRGHQGADVLSGIFTALDDVMKERGERCLADHGRLVAHPAWEPGARKRYGSRIEQIRACNLLDGVHLVPVWAGEGRGDVHWRPVTVMQGERVDVAYSLAVEPHRTYLVDGGIVTSNCIYGFRGAVPEGLLEHPVPAEDRFVLGQSYRLPAAVHRCAEAWVRRLTRREVKPYAPRAYEGAARASKARYDDAGSMLREVEAALARTVVDADTGVQRPATVMVLASCSYMLDPLKHALREAGVPFHNPYRRRRGDWNPLAPGRGVSSKDRLVSYLAPDESAFGDRARMWTGEDVRRWVQPLRTQGLFARGAKGRLAALGDGPVEFEDLLALFPPDVDAAVIDRAFGPDLGWFKENLLAAARAPMAFPIRVAERRGAAELLEPPRVVLGTIHSSKGGQADVVLLIPDLSARGSAEWQRAGVPRDGVIRQFYVGMTRAREELAVCAPATGMYVPPVRLLQGARSSGGGR